MKLLSVSVADAPLGGIVRLDLEPKRTVLVGHNGAGKSLYLESLHDAAILAVRRGYRRALGITHFVCEIEYKQQRFEYSFDRHSRSATLDDDPNNQSGVVWDWSERCLNRTSSKELWKVENGVATIDNQEIKLEPGIGLLGVGPTSSVQMPEGLFVVRDILARVRRVSAGVPRQSEPRGTLILMRDPNNRGPWLPIHSQGPDYRVESVARLILNWYEIDQEKFREYQALGQRLQLWKKLEPTIVPKALAAPTPDAAPRDVGVLAVDKVNFGCLSDGTLRAAEILAWLLSGTAKALLIEEPETSIHPGLLSRLLHEIDSYSLQTQVIISTHSPYVVSQSQPNELRLVRRVKEKTNINPLNTEQFARIREYLCDEGTLGEFMFGGGID